MSTSLINMSIVHFTLLGETYIEVCVAAQSRLSCEFGKHGLSVNSAALKPELRSLDLEAQRMYWTSWPSRSVNAFSVRPVS